MAGAKNISQTILNFITTDPIGLRDALADQQVVAALGSIGLVYEPAVMIHALHAPGASARTDHGFGVTLCERKGTRHQDVTCKNCLKALEGLKAMKPKAAKP